MPPVSFSSPSSSSWAPVWECLRRESERGRGEQEKAPRLTLDLDLEAAALVREASPLVSDFDPAISSSQFYCLKWTASLLILFQQQGQRAKACIDNTDFMVAVNMRPLFNM